MTTKRGARTFAESEVTETALDQIESAGAASKRPTYQQGQSGNVDGRPANLAARIRERTNNGEIITTFLVGLIERGLGTVRDRVEAGKILYERGWGKSPETHLVGAMSPEQAQLAASLSREQLMALIGDPGPLPEGTVEGTLVPQLPENTDPTD